MSPSSLNCFLYGSIGLQVFFNDPTSNDFNTLFKSLPPERNYFAAGVPGTFYGPLFPKASLHFASSVPNEAEDKGSAAWNKERILHGGSKEAREVYACQFANDMEKLQRTRAMELVCGSFMALLLPCIPTGANLSNRVSFQIRTKFQCFDLVVFLKRIDIQ